MYEGKISSCNSIYIEELDQTYSKSEILNMSASEVKMLLGFMNQRELNKVSKYSEELENIVTNIFDRL